MVILTRLMLQHCTHLIALLSLSLSLSLSPPSDSSVRPGDAPAVRERGVSDEPADRDGGAVDGEELLFPVSDDLSDDYKAIQGDEYRGICQEEEYLSKRW
eukprot:CAMPEP_0182438132 /NCGR_PEP_ID=MMETSP1167-20130531/85534_1 /TAXON_ID=2988 /ORGANISM="Mallomonas Sp, Strain CCMP3275" /LENGTH=99 /DNA_ID=CAMNT_0024631331 /DNA_START=1196 /DNA_END=1494 /DNA_ORIENTATION=-